MNDERMNLLFFYNKVKHTFLTIEDMNCTTITEAVKEKEKNTNGNFHLCPDPSQPGRDPKEKEELYCRFLIFMHWNIFCI